MKEIKIRKLKAEEIELRVGRVIKTAKFSGVTLLLYKNARVDMAILDEIFTPFGWKREHEVVNGNMYCTVSALDKESGEWVSKQDCGTESHTEGEKGEASDSFKRACVNWGIGRELYSAPEVLIACELDEKGKVKSGMGWSVGEIDYNQAGEISRLTIIQHERKESDKVVFDWTKEEKTAPPKQEKKSAYGLVRDLIKGSEYKLDDVTAFIQENFGANIRINDLTAEQFKKVYAAYYHSIKGAVWDGKTYA
ncbi:MAG: hypothetical protein J6Z36_00910 [Clostridia bacterium]|nr:hypothetical protein [Clostridia bacterium]